jgi:hypothetical protein
MQRIKRFDEGKIYLPEVKPTGSVYFGIKIIDHKDTKELKDGGQLGKDYIYPKVFEFEKDADIFVQKLANDEFKNKDIQIIHLYLEKSPTTSSPTTTDTTSTDTETTTVSTEPGKSSGETKPVDKKMSMDLYLKLKNDQQMKKLRQSDPAKFQKQISLTSDIYSKYKTSKEKSDYLLSEIAKELKMDISEMKDVAEVEARIKSVNSKNLQNLINELQKLYPQQLKSNYKGAPVIDSYKWNSNRILRFNEGIIAMAGVVAATLCGLAALRGLFRRPTNQTGPGQEWFKIGKRSIPHPISGAELKTTTYKKPYVIDPNRQIGSFFGTKV